MKLYSKKLFLFASGLIAVGLMLCLIATVFIDFDFKRLNTISYETKDYFPEGSFDRLEIRTASSDIRLLPSQNGKLRVTCDESERTAFRIQISGDTLHITETNMAKWYQQIGFYWGVAQDPTVTVYLPRPEYRSLTLNSTSGDIKVGADFSFDEAELETTSGDIEFFGRTSRGLSVRTTSGDVTAANSAGVTVKAHAVSGDVELTGIQAAELSADTTSGQLRLVDCQIEGDLTVNTVSGEAMLIRTQVAGKAKLESVSGDIVLDRADAALLDLHTVSGDIEGSLLRSKSFDYSTVSGSMRLPPSDPSGGSCVIKTTSGSARIVIESP